MNIVLPDKFHYKGNKHESAVIEHEILYIEKGTDFEEVMYQLTYKLKGRNCMYCGRPLESKKKTLDHLYPRSIGGPTITNNLTPACKNSNNRKSDMTEQEFIEFCRLKGQDREDFRKKVMRKHENARQSHGFLLPKRWYVNFFLKEVITFISFDESISKRYQRLESFYKRYGNFDKPIVVDRNGFLLDGFGIVLFAKNKGIREIPTIILENVEKRF